MSENVSKICVTVWNEHRHFPAEVKAIYPRGLHAAIAESLAEDPGLTLQTAVMDQPEQGLPDELLERTQVLVWWGHMHHKEISDLLSLKVQKRVLEGMGLIVLHSACWAKPFIQLMGSTCQLNYRMTCEREMLWAVNAGHPIVAGLGDGFVIPSEEVYCEYFDVPQPDELVFISTFEGGEAFRSGCCWRRGAGRIFYFRPGHETCPTYHQPEVKRLLLNAVRWACPAGRMEFESGPKQRGWLGQPRGQEQKVIGASHPFTEILDPCKYLR